MHSQNKVNINEFLCREVPVGLVFAVKYSAEGWPDEAEVRFRAFRTGGQLTEQRHQGAGRAVRVMAKEGGCRHQVGLVNGLDSLLAKRVKVDLDGFSGLGLEREASLEGAEPRCAWITCSQGCGPMTNCLTRPSLP